MGGSIGLFKAFLEKVYGFPKLSWNKVIFFPEEIVSCEYYCLETHKGVVKNYKIAKFCKRCQFFFNKQKPNFI